MKKLFIYYSYYNAMYVCMCTNIKLLNCLSVLLVVEFWPTFFSLKVETGVTSYNISYLQSSTKVGPSVSEIRQKKQT